MNSRRGVLRSTVLSIIAVSGCSNIIPGDKKKLKKGDLEIENNDSVPHQITVQVTKNQSEEIYKHLSLNIMPGERHYYSNFINDNGLYKFEITMEVGKPQSVPLRFPSPNAIEVSISNTSQLIVSQKTI